MTLSQKKRLTGAARTGIIASLLLAGLASPRLASARDTTLQAGDADAAFAAFNRSFLINADGKTFYKKSINSDKPDDFWLQALDIMVAEDTFERTKSPDTKALINRLCTTFLQNNPPPWAWDGWNDDIGWVSLALIRAYQITGNPDFLKQAKYGFEFSWKRGWDTEFNGGGIWEQQPEKTPSGEFVSKEALSNDSLGKVACLIYQSTHEAVYLSRAKQIYAWVRANLYNADTGQVYTGIDRNGTLDTGTAVYNQGTFVDFANYLYQITGDKTYYGDAKRSIDYVRSRMTTGGIISNSAGYLNTWADEFARGLGHFVRDNREWDTYHPWMVQNANAILASRRTDRNLTWNGWAKPTPTDDSFAATKFASAVSWLQFTPATKPAAAGKGKKVQ